jgi:hypothetical protein
MSVVSHYVFEAAKKPAFVLALQFVLPNSEDTPAGFSQFAIYGHGSLSVHRNFKPPEFPMAFRLAVAARTAVPKTAVNKNSQPKFMKNKIRLPDEAVVSPPAGNTKVFQQANKAEFGGRIPV